MRQIKVGDKVQSYWNANLIGRVVKITAEKPTNWMVGGTMDVAVYCDVLVESGSTIRCKTSDVFLIDL